MEKRRAPRLRTRLITATVLLCSLVLLMQGVVMIFLLARNFSDTAYDDAAFFMQNSHALLSGKFSFLENVVLNMRNNPAMRPFYTGTYDDSIQEQYSFSANLLSEQNLVSSYMPFVTDIYLFNQEGDCLRTHYYEYTATQTEMRRLEERARTLYEQFAASPITVNSHVDGDGLYLIVKLYNTDLTQQGVCLVRTDLDALAALQAQQIERYAGTCWLLCNDEEIIARYGAELSEESTERLLRQERSGLQTVTLDGEDHFASAQNLSFGLRSVMAVPRGQVFAGIRLMSLSFGLSILLLILITLGVVLAFSMYLTRPLHTVADKISQFGQGDLQTKLVPFGIQEFDDIGDVFNRMTEQIHTLVTEVYENQILANQAEIRYLQSQINPHFLYNVLTTISLRAKMDGDETTYRMLHALSKLLQGKLFRSRELKLQLHEELELVEFYLYLQNMRFPDHISYSIQCDESLLTALIPRLCIEPLVENAVVHGLEPKEDPGEVRVRVYAREEKLYIAVQDNGVGFAAESVGADHTHVGLGIIRDLIGNLYGDGYGMTVESAPGEGTKVELCLPLEWGST